MDSQKPSRPQRYSLLVSFSIRNLILSAVIAICLVAFFTEVESRVVFFRLMNRVQGFGDQLAYQLQAELPAGKGLASLLDDSQTLGRVLRWIQSEMTRTQILAVHVYDHSGKVLISTVDGFAGRTVAGAVRDMELTTERTRVHVGRLSSGELKLPQPMPEAELVSGFTKVDIIGPQGGRMRLIVHIVHTAEDLVLANRTAKLVVGISVFIAASVLYLGSFFMVKAGSDRLQSFTRVLEDMVQERTRELRQRTQELEAIVRGMGDGLVVIDGVDRIVRVNPKALEILQVEEQDIVGKSVMELTRLFDLSNERLTDAINRYYADPKATYHITVPSPFDGTVLLDTTLAKIRNEEGKISGNVVIIKLPVSKPPGSVL